MRILVVAGVLTALVGGTPLSGGVQPVVAQPAPILWGAYIDGAPADESRLDAFESRAGKGVSIQHWAVPWFRSGAARPFPAADFQTVRDHGSIPMLTWGSWDFCCGMNQPQFKLSAIASGEYDDYLSGWAGAARAWGHPFFLRFDWEMNGWWQFPWAEQVNGNQPGEYVQAWRHVHDLFTQQDATNATWVWCPNVSQAKTTPISTLYPGDQYVDWTCMDGYNWGTDQGNSWQSFAQVFSGSAYNQSHNTYQELLSVAPEKPIMIGEVATSRNGGDSGAWVRDALKQQLPANFPLIKALVWFNWDANDPTLSWPIESSPSTQAGFAEGIASSYFASNQYGNLDTSPIPATPVVTTEQ